MRKLGDDNPCTDKNTPLNEKSQEAISQKTEELRKAESLLCDRAWERNAYKFFGYPDFHRIKETDFQNIRKTETYFLELLYTQWGPSVDLADRLIEFKESLSKAKISLTDTGQKKAYDSRLEAIKFQELTGELDGRISVSPKGRSTLSLFAWDAVRRKIKEQGVAEGKGPGSLERLDAQIKKELRKRNASILTWQEEFSKFYISKSELGLDIKSTRKALKDFLDELKCIAPSSVPSLSDALIECEITLESPLVRFEREIVRYIQSRLSEKEYGKILARAKTEFFLEEQEVEDAFKRLRGLSIDGDRPQVFFWKKAVEDKKDVCLLDSLMDEVRTDYPDDASVKTFEALKSADRECEIHAAKIGQHKRKNRILAAVAAIAIGFDFIVAAFYYMLPMPVVLGFVSAMLSFIILQSVSGSPNTKIEGERDPQSVHERTLKFLLIGEDIQKIQIKRSPNIRGVISAGAVIISGSILLLLLVTIQIGSASAFLIAPQLRNGEIMIPKGRFTMGTGKPLNPQEVSPRHEVVLEYDLIVRQYETTNEEWDVYKATTTKEDEKYVPKSKITIWESMEFCNFSSRQAELPEAYIIKTIKGMKILTGYHPENGGWRLPTEEEWEYMASKGSLFRGSKYSSMGGSWKAGMNFSSKPVDVQTTPTNIMGVGGLNCNIQEWCLTSELLILSLPMPLDTGRFVTKGGSYQDSHESCMNFSRFYQEGSERRNGTGFRMVRTATK